jgi:hypothetical protein
MVLAWEMRSYSPRTPTENGPSLRRRAESLVSNSDAPAARGGPKDFPPKGSRFHEVFRGIEFLSLRMDSPLRSRR